MSKKLVTVEQLLENARQSESLTMQVAEAAVASIEAKQDKLTGTQGQVVGFDADGKAIAQAAPPTMEQVNAAISAAITGAINASY